MLRRGLGRFEKLLRRILTQQPGGRGFWPGLRRGSAGAEGSTILMPTPRVPFSLACVASRASSSSNRSKTILAKIAGLTLIFVVPCGWIGLAVILTLWDVIG